MAHSAEVEASATRQIVFYAVDPGYMAGSSAVAAGDFNADGNVDIPIGSAFGDGAYVIFG